MDTSKEYINLCEKAVEIQKLIFSLDDIYAGKPTNCRCYGDVNYIKEIDIGYCKSESLMPMKYRMNCGCKEYKKVIWLPRIDQLIEMLGTLEEQSKMLIRHLVTRITPIENSKGLYEYTGSVIGDFGSWERLLLHIVMKECFSKTWNGKDWIK